MKKDERVKAVDLCFVCVFLSSSFLLFFMDTSTLSAIAFTLLVVLSALLLSSNQSHTSFFRPKNKKRERTCWFCGANQLTLDTEEWQCVYCEQHNGFGADGDYLSEHPELWDETHNPRPLPRGGREGSEGRRERQHLLQEESGKWTEREEGEEKRESGGGRGRGIWRVQDASILCGYCGPRQARYVDSLLRLHRYIDADHERYSDVRNDFEKSFALCAHCEERVREVIAEKDRKVKAELDLLACGKHQNASSSSSSLLTESLSTPFVGSHSSSKSSSSQPSSFSSSFSLSSICESLSQEIETKSSSETIEISSSDTLPCFLRNLPSTFTFPSISSLSLATLRCVLVYCGYCEVSNVWTSHSPPPQPLLSSLLLLFADIFVASFSLLFVPSLLCKVFLVVLFLVSMVFDDIACRYSASLPLILILQVVIRCLKFAAFALFTPTFFRFLSSFYGTPDPSVVPSPPSLPPSSFASPDTVNERNESYWREYRKVNPTLIPLSRPLPRGLHSVRMASSLSGVASPLRCQQVREVGERVEERLDELRI